MRPNKLKPCPFCGRVPLVEVSKDFWGTKYYRVACRHTGCGMKPITVWYAMREAALNDWNRRATDEEI